LKSKSLNKSKNDNNYFLNENKNNKNDEEDPIYEKLYKMHKDKELKFKTLSIEKEKQLRQIYTFTPQIGNVNSKEEGNSRTKKQKSDFFDRIKK
jgi:hypothetical protein